MNDPSAGDSEDHFPDPSIILRCAWNNLLSSTWTSVHRQYKGAIIKKYMLMNNRTTIPVAHQMQNSQLDVTA